MIPYILSADLALLYLVKHGQKPPEEADLKDPHGRSCSLEEALLITIGLVPSPQAKFIRTTLFSYNRAQMLREVYLVVNEFRRLHWDTFEKMTLTNPLEAYHRLMRVHFDPLTRCKIYMAA